MATREDIREGIANLSQMDSDDCSYELCEYHKDNCRVCRATAVVEYLHSQGVVLKVDKPMPKDCPGCVENAIKAGYEATESLVEG